MSEYGPLKAPSKTAIEVFDKVLEHDPDADMRAIPNQWLLNERGRSEKLSAEIGRCRYEAIGWAWAEACRQLDLGLDPRQYDCANLVARAKTELVPPTEGGQKSHYELCGCNDLECLEVGCKRMKASAPDRR